MANETRVGSPVKAVGGLRSGDIGTPLPTDAVSVLDAALKALGLIGEDGLSESEERSTEDERAWGGSIARTVQTEYGLKVTFTFIERTTAVLQEVRGKDNVIEEKVAGGTQRTVLFNSKTLPPRVYVADIKDGDYALRKVYPNAQITEVGETQFVHSTLIKYEVTLTAYEDEHGNNEYEYDFVPDAAA